MSTPNWEAACQQTANYRNFLAEQTIPENAKIKAYLFTKEAIEKLLNQSEDSLDGIRVYIGQEHFEEGTAIRLYAVGAKKNELGEYHDYNIPTEQGAEGENEETGPEEGFPCPSYCSNENPLNGG